LSGIVEQRVAIEGGAILTDGSDSGNAALAYFASHAELKPQAATMVASAVAKGRGGAFFLDVGSHRWVARPYRRGGLVALVSKDRYLWNGEQNVRSFREWRTLAALRAQGLPVPAPVAARYRRRGSSYRAELITERLENTEPLSVRLEREMLSLATWVAIGRCIRRLHDAGAYHADLNAHNILLTAGGTDATRVWVVDFDRGSIRRQGLWRDANLARLYRSLRKISVGLAPDRFTAAEWGTLLASYRVQPGKSGDAAHGAA
jgi:3-deoxy-D-manno-octulosonic acid kinase